MSQCNSNAVIVQNFDSLLPFLRPGQFVINHILFLVLLLMPFFTYADDIYFHWGDEAGNSVMLENRDSASINSGWIKRLIDWQESKKIDFVGLYLAENPYQTRSYGNDLVIVQVKKTATRHVTRSMGKYNVIKTAPQQGDGIQVYRASSDARLIDLVWQNSHDQLIDAYLVDSSLVGKSLSTNAFFEKIESEKIIPEINERLLSLINWAKGKRVGSFQKNPYWVIEREVELSLVSFRRLSHNLKIDQELIFELRQIRLFKALEYSSNRHFEENLNLLEKLVSEYSDLQSSIADDAKDLMSQMILKIIERAEFKFGKTEIKKLLKRAHYRIENRATETGLACRNIFLG